MSTTSSAATRRDPFDGAKPWTQHGSVVILAVAVALVPIFAAAVRAVVDHWQPLSDNGITAVRTMDVFSRYFPLLGNETSVSISSGLARIANHPGPLQFLLLAPVVALAGPAAGLAIGTAAINAVAVAVAAWVAWRRTGICGGLLAALVGALLSWSMGSALLVDPWAPHALMLPLFASCMLAWAVAAGDLPLLPFAVAFSSFVVQTHVSVAYIGPALLIVAAGWGWLRTGRRGWKWIVIAALVGVVLWAPPIFQQLSSPDGNMTRLLEAARQPPRGAVGPADAVRVTASVVAFRPFWLRDSLWETLRRPGTGLQSTAIGIGQLPLPSLAASLARAFVVAALLGAGAWIARLRRDRESLTAMVMAAVVLVLAWYTTAHVTTRIIGVSAHTFRSLWPAAAFVTFAVALGVVRALTGRAVAVAYMGIGLIIVAVSIANLPTATSSGGAQVDAWAMPVVRSIDRQLGVARADAPLLADWPGIAYGEPYSAAFAAELRRRGIPFVVRDRGLVGQYGSARRYDGRNARSQVFYRLGAEARRSRIGPFRRIAFHSGVARDERSNYRSLTRSVRNALLRGEIRPAPALRDARQLGLYRDLGFPFTTRADAARAVMSSQISGAWRQHLVRAPARVAQRLAILSRVQLRADRATVGVFVGPVGARVP